MDKATQKSIEWQKANNPMAIGGDAFADMIDSFNVNPAYIAGYKEAEKDLIPLINRLCEAILFDWKDKAELAWKIQSRIKEEWPEGNGPETSFAVP